MPPEAQSHTVAGGLVAPAAVRAGLAALLEPPSDISITEGCEESRFLYNPGGGYSGPYRRALAPYCVDIQDSLKDRLYRTTAFVAPGQCGKTEILLNWAHHSVVYDPADMLIVLDEKDQAEDFIDRRIKRWIQYNEVVSARLEDDKRYFRSFTGMSLATLWATGSKAASKPAPRIALDERDSMDDDLDGEGDPVDLFEKRLETFKDAAKLYASSSPKKPLRRGKADRPAPLGPHEAPRTTGILAIYNRGTRKRLYWQCPHCAEWHTPEFGMLRWLEGASADDELLGEWLECPHNGCAIEPSHKHAMLAAARWVAEGQTIDAEGRIHGAPRHTRTDSYWLRGPSNAFMSWADLIRKKLAADAEFADTGSDAKLKTFWQLEEAAPYVPPEGEDEIHLDAEALARRVEPELRLGVVPAESRFLTAQVDVQGNRFEVEIRAWGVGLESWLVHRFPVFQTEDPTAPDGKRLLDPANRAEDWDLLFDRVLGSSWPVAGTGLRARIACTAIDAFGQDGVTPQAYDFWRRAHRRGFGRYRLMLTKGSSRANAPLISWSQPELSGGRKPKGGGGYAWLASINVHAFKDVVARRLAIEEPGPLYLHIPEAVGEISGIDYFAELTAEAKIDDKWVRQRPRNEALDHLVQSIAITLHLRANRIDWASPPSWARSWPENPNAAGATKGTAGAPPAAGGASLAAAAAPAAPTSDPAARPAPAPAANDVRKPAPASRVIRSSYVSRNRH